MATAAGRTGSVHARATVTLPSDREIVITREFDAPRELVFEAWTKPEHVKEWWGPNGFSMPVCEIDLRSGGAYRFVSRSPDRGDFPFKGVYHEIVAPERLVCTQIFDVEPWSSVEAVITAIFEDDNGRTKVTSTSVFPTAEARDAEIASGMEGGMQETFERLDDYLETMV